MIESIVLFPDDVDLSADLAEALWRSGRVDEAEKIATSVLKKSSQHPMARGTLAKIFEHNGLEAQKLEQWGRAIAAFERALAMKPQNRELGRNMALLLYNFRLKSKFLPQAASRKDMDRALILFTEAQGGVGDSAEALETQIGIAVHSSQPKAAVAPCVRLQKEFGGSKNMVSLLDCAEAFKLDGQKEKAHQLLFEALNKESFKSQRPQLDAALRGLE